MGGELRRRQRAWPGQLLHADLPKVFAGGRTSEERVVLGQWPNSLLPRTPTPEPTSGASRRRPVETPAFPDSRSRTDSIPNGACFDLEDDVAFAEILADLARELSFQFLVAHSAEEGIAWRCSSACGHHFGRQLAGSLGADRARPAEAERRYAAHPGARHVGRRLLRAWRYHGRAGYLLKPVVREDLMAVFTDMKERFDALHRL